MMHKLMVLYPPPTDPAAFRSHYEAVHLGLVARMPGLLASHHAFDVAGVAGPSPYFCIWEGLFADLPAMAAAMQSAAGQAVAADVANYATGGATVLHFHVAADMHAAH